MKKNDQNTNAFLIHISAFAGFVFPFGHIITPLIAWQTLKDRSPFLDEQGKEAVNFNLSYTLYSFILTLALIPLAIGTFFTNFNNFDTFNLNLNLNIPNMSGFIGIGAVSGILYVAGIALVIIAAIKAKEGENYNYPFTIKFIK
ncbi:DUF4870 domain-containing protein [Polaribacter sp.]|nr:DUF4870 domain-containing protein [Polaribacter sp.]MDB4037128.1 DUF4870 domain-containing protein [Polaribacter sp.]MDC1237057.1 DUF4870 domain-containing protein [Polaribacter sp.]